MSGWRGRLWLRRPIASRTISPAIVVVRPVTVDCPTLLATPVAVVSNVDTDVINTTRCDSDTLLSVSPPFSTSV